MLFASFTYTDLDFRPAIGLAATINPFWITTLPLERGVESFAEPMAGGAPTSSKRAPLQPI